MKRIMLQDTYPVHVLEVAKSDTSLRSVDEVLAFLKGKIEAHPKATYIATFDHYSHTRALGGEIAAGMKDAKNIVFCFGVKLPGPAVLAVRPRPIGVADMGEKFVISFMEAPMPMANDAMSEWLGLIADRRG